MADFLDYIRRQVENIEDTISDSDILKKAGIYETVEYIGDDPDFIWGAINNYYNTAQKLTSTNEKGPDDRLKKNLVSGKYGVNVDFLIKAKRVADTQDEKVRAIWFRNLILSEEGYKDPDNRIAIEKLYRVENYEEVAKAMANVINYKVLNTQYVNYSEYFFGIQKGINKMNNNITFENLPYGKLSAMVANSWQDSLSLYESNVLKLCRFICPQNLNFTNNTVDDTLKILRCVVNKDKEYVRFLLPQTQAIGFIKNKKITLSRFNDDNTCKPLSISTETDLNDTKFPVAEKSVILEELTNYSLQESQRQPEGCSVDELLKIDQDAQFVSNLATNQDFVKIEDVLGRNLLYNISVFASISKVFEDSDLGKNSISLKVYFDKKNDVFASVRANDLFFAVYCATYGFSDELKVDLYFNQVTKDIYIVNSNGVQFGLCKGISASQLSNCEYVVYAQLLQSSLTEMAKYNLMVEGNTIPVVLDQGVVRQTKGLQEALNRQNYLLAIQDDAVFFDLFLRNIASYVYSYAYQEEDTRDITVKYESGEQKPDEISRLIWKTKPNPQWSDTPDNDVFDTEKGVWSNPNYSYIYDVRETFWQMNSSMTISEVLAFFVSKADNLPNSSYFRKLCQRILGVDYVLFYKKLLIPLLDAGLLCIEELEYEKSTKVLKNVKFSYSAEYSSGDVWGKLAKLEGQLGSNIEMLYGQVKGNKYIAHQTTLLNDAKPKMVTFGNQIPELNLTLNVHNPIFFKNSTGYIGKVGKATGTLRNGQVSISTEELKAGERYKGLKLDRVNQTNYKSWRDSKPSTLNHLDIFEGWLKYGPGEDMISKDYITPNMIRDAYIFPIDKKFFIPLYVMPNFSERVNKGKTKISLPLQFLDKSIKVSGYKAIGQYTFSNLYSTSVGAYSVGNSFLTQLSREHLIKAGLVAKKKKIKYDYTDPKTSKKISFTFTPITEDEAKKIDSIIVSRYNKLESEIRLEGDRLFTAFCQTQMQPEYSKEIEILWNATYNNLAIPNYKKFPIFCEHSRYFGKISKPFVFSLREAQVEGMKFSVSNANAGLLAHEVGFGKTTTSIALISHMNLTGESSRNIVFTPNQVYEKFYDEITGNLATGRLGLLGNWNNSYNVVKMGNALPNVLLGKLDSKGRPAKDKEGRIIDGIKNYNPEEREIIRKFREVLDGVKNTIGGVKKTGKKKGYVQGTGLPMRQVRFFTDQDTYSKIPNDVVDSDAYDWYISFREEIMDKIEELDLENYRDKVAPLWNEIEVYIEKMSGQVESAMEKLKTENYYQPIDFSKGNIKSLPKYLQKWHRSARAKAQTQGRPIFGTDYPLRNWIYDIDGAVEIGVITPKRAQALKQQEKTSGEPWEGTLTESGYQKMFAVDDKLSERFFSRDKRQGSITVLIESMKNKLVDVLGRYKDKVMLPNTIILCSYDKQGGSIRRFRATKKARNEAKMYVSNVDALIYTPESANNAFEELALAPLSFRNLNVSGIVVDEIHNFNNLIGKPRPHTLSYVPLVRLQKGENRKLHLLPTQSASARLSSLPNGSRVSLGKAFDVRYNSSGKGKLAVGSTGLMSLIFEIQNSSINKAKKVNNSIVMSATPFTDNVFQMFSVLGMTNRKRLKESNLQKVFEFFVTFVKEEWRFNITHKNEFGLFSEIQGYYNTFAMSNFIKAMANFKVSDVDIEKNRPKKYLIPQEKGLRDQAGSNTSSVNYSKYLEDVESYVELSEVQKIMLSKIAGFVEGVEPSPYVICPNYGDFKPSGGDDGEFLESEEYQELWEESKKKIKEAEKDDANRTLLLEEALDILEELREENKGNKTIANRYNKVSDILYSTGKSAEDTEEDIQEVLTDFDNIDVLALDEEQVYSARAIVGQSYGQRLVLSPYLLSCDIEGQLSNEFTSAFK